MPASRPSAEAGRRLKAERMRLRLSTRDVERLSRKLAQEKKNQDFYLSHAWLTEIENGEFTPGIYKLYSLSIIYKRGFDEILALFDIHLGDIRREQMWLALPRTHLIREEQGTPPRTIEIPPELRATVQCEKTSLVTQMFSQYGGPPVSVLPPLDTSQSLHGYIGTKDFTLFPLIRPGSFVQIDTTQKKIMHAGWSNEFDRPIYFVELRNGYACAWCELEDRKLLLVPCPQARIPVRQFRFPDDAGILGRVTAVSMRIADTRNDD